MSKPRHRQVGITSIGVLLGVTALVFLISHLLLASGLISPLPRNGINVIEVLCDGQKGEISTQRYYGFEDYAVDVHKEFPDLPIHSRLRCQQAAIRIERRTDLRDRFEISASCDGYALDVSDFDTITCPGLLGIEVKRH